MVKLKPSSVTLHSPPALYIDTLKRFFFCIFLFSVVTLIQFGFYSWALIMTKAWPSYDHMSYKSEMNDLTVMIEVRL